MKQKLEIYEAPFMDGDEMVTEGVFDELEKIWKDSKCVMKNGSTITFTHYPLADPIRGFHKPLGFYPPNY